MESTDAVVIGAGHNGLVAANLLADAGWSVLVLEATAQPGGAVRSGFVTAPGYLSDRDAGARRLPFRVHGRARGWCDASSCSCARCRAWAGPTPRSTGSTWRVRRPIRAVACTARRAPARPGAAPARDRRLTGDLYAAAIGAAKRAVYGRGR